MLVFSFTLVPLVSCKNTTDGELSEGEAVDVSWDTVSDNLSSESSSDENSFKPENMDDENVKVNINAMYKITKGFIYMKKLICLALVLSFALVPLVSCTDRKSVV